MVYIHGGALEEGAANQHPPNYLLEKNILLVVPQYRLGPLGFLSTNTTEISGNFGLLDIVLALKWIKSNIKYFGGNPLKISIFGQSAGAAIISALMLSPSVPSDFFQSAILQSGAIGAEWAVGTKHLQNAKEISKIIGCTSDIEILSTTELNKCLMESNVLELLKAYEQQQVNQNCIIMYSVTEFQCLVELCFILQLSKIYRLVRYNNYITYNKLFSKSL